MSRGEIGERFDIIRFDGERLLDKPCRCRVLAPRMRDQPEMMEANEMTGLVLEDCRIGRLRLRITPGAKIFERVREHLRVGELARNLSVIEPALASRRCHLLRGWVGRRLGGRPCAKRAGAVVRFCGRFVHSRGAAIVYALFPACAVPGTAAPGLGLRQPIWYPSIAHEHGAMRVGRNVPARPEWAKELGENAPSLESGD
jgi:hypothetical protein